MNCFVDMNACMINKVEKYPQKVYRNVAEANQKTDYF